MPSCSRPSRPTFRRAVRSVRRVRLSPQRAVRAPHPVLPRPCRLDAARRLGALIAAAELGGLAFADAGASPSVGRGFARLYALALAHRLLAHPHASVDRTRVV